MLPFGSSKVVYIDENKEIMEGLDEAAAHFFGELVSIDVDTITVQCSLRHNVTMTQSISNDGEGRGTVSFGAQPKSLFGIFIPIKMKSLANIKKERPRNLPSC